MKVLLQRIRRAVRVRFCVTKPEQDFLNIIKKLADVPGKQETSASNKGYFLVEAMGVNQSMSYTQGLFAKTGQLEGCIPVIVMSRYVRKHKAVFCDMGINNIELHQKVLTLSDRFKAYRWANKVYSQIKSPEELLKFTYDGIPMGSYAYSTYLFKHMTGTLKKVTPDIKKYLRESYLNYIYIERLIAKYDPKFVVLTNNTYIECGTLFQTALNHGITAYVAVWPASNKVSIKRYDRNTNTKDLCVVNPSHEEWGYIINRNRKEWLDKGRGWMERRLRGEDKAFGGMDSAVGKPWITKKEVYNMLKIDANKKVALVCSHVMWDDPVIYTSIYRDYYWWWLETVKIINNIEDVTWILKAHPGEMDTLGRRTHQTPIRSLDVISGIRLKSNVIFLDSGLQYNNYSLMQVADALVTVRGTVGMEYATQGIPVITAGTGSYSCAGFDINCKTVEEYKNALQNVSKLDRLKQDKIDKALIFTYFYMAGGTSIEVKGLPQDFKIENLTELSITEYLSDGAWRDIIRRMMLKNDCREIC